MALAAQQPGYLGVEARAARTASASPRRTGPSEAAIGAWKHQAEHAATRAHGRTHWYDHFELRVASHERATEAATAMSTILDTILARKREEVAARRERVSLFELKARAASALFPLRFRDAVAAKIAAAMPR